MDEVKNNDDQIQKMDMIIGENAVER